MTLERTIRPRGPYSLALSGRRASDPTRRFGNGVLTCLLAGGERAGARQLSDGALVLHAASEAGVEHVRFVLGLEDDHTEFLRRFATTRRSSRTTRRFRGLRPFRTGTVAQALLRAVAGQLILSSRGARDRAGLVGVAADRARRRAPPPTVAADFARFSPAQLERLGLLARRRSALVRLSRSIDLEALKAPSDRGRRSPAAARARPRAVVDRRRLACRASAATSAGSRAISGS